MNPNFTHQHGDGTDFPPDVEAFLNNKCIKYMKLKSRLEKCMPSSRICRLAIPNRCSCPTKIKETDNFTPHVHVINLDVRPRTRLDQLAYPGVRKLLANRDAYRTVYHPRRYHHINRMIRRSLFSLYSRLANVQPPKKPVRPRPLTKHEWRRHLKALKKLSTPRQTSIPPKIPSESVPLEELMPRIKKLCKPKKLFFPPPGPKPKNLSDFARTLELAKPKEFDPTLYIKPEPAPIDRSVPYKPPKRTLTLAEPKGRSANESDMKENPFQVSPNALKYKCREGSRLANLAKPKEYEEPPINPNAFTVKKNALKATASKRTIELAQPKGS